MCFTPDNKEAKHEKKQEVRTWLLEPAGGDVGGLGNRFIKSDTPRCGFQYVVRESCDPAGNGWDGEFGAVISSRRSAPSAIHRTGFVLCFLARVPGLVLF